MIYIGSGSSDKKSGILIKIPDKKYDIIGLKIKSSYHHPCFSSIYADNGENIGIFCNNGTEISPDGGISDSIWIYHKWMYIPVKKAKDIILSNSYYSNDGYLGGISFGKNNLWSFTINSAIAFYKFAHEGNSNFRLQNNALCMLYGRKSIIYVPVIPNGKDKILFLVVLDSLYTKKIITEIKANGINIERLRNTYINPFSYHYNFQKNYIYLGAKVQEKIIKENDTLIKTTLDFSKQNYNNNYYNSYCFKIVSAGTHDYE